MKHHTYTVCKALTCMILLAVSVISCRKDSDFVSLDITTENYWSATKTFIDAENYSCWSGHEESIMINGNSYQVTLQSSGRARITGVAASNTGYTAVYPTDIVSGPMGGNTIAVQLPAVQSYEAYNGVQEIHSPMAAYTNGESLHFRNLCSLVSVTVTNDTTIDLTLKDITITSDHAPLSGSATINVTEHPTLTATGTDEASRSVTLEFFDKDHAVILASGESRSFYVSLPAVAAASRLSITVRGNTLAGNHQVTRSQNGVTLNASCIAQGPSCSPRLHGYFFGNGTADNPYLVENQNDLDILRDRVHNNNTYGGKYFSVTHDIYCARPHHSISYENNASMTFCGIFNGHDHVITFTSMYSTSNTMGLFGNIGPHAQLLNIHVAGTFAATFQSSQTYPSFGVISGTADNSNTIANCSSSAHVTNVTLQNGGAAGTWNIGGILGTGSVTLRNCSFTGSITLNGPYTVLRMGGIRGACGEGGQTVGCTSQGTINVTNTYDNDYGSPSNQIGGVIGYQYRTSLSDCTNSTAITANTKRTTYVGGIIGASSSLHGDTYSDFHNNGSINVTCRYEAYAGGIIGNAENSHLVGCNNAATIQAESTERGSYVGGIAGGTNNHLNYTIRECHNTGSLTALSSNSSTAREASCAGIVGKGQYGHLRNLGNTGSLTAISAAGCAIVGGIANQWTANVALDNCYNQGTLTATGSTTQVGGISGRFRGSIHNCYNTASTGIGGYGIFYDAESATTEASHCYWLNGTASTATNYGNATYMVGFDADGTLLSPAVVGSHSATNSLLQALNDWAADNGANYSSWSLGSNGLPIL